MTANRLRRIKGFERIAKYMLGCYNERQDWSHTDLRGYAVLSWTQTRWLIRRLQQSQLIAGRWVPETAQRGGYNGYRLTRRGVELFRLALGNLPAPSTQS